jgi:O-antigen ligase
MGLYGFTLIINPQQIRNVIFHKAFFFLLIINALNILYFLLCHSIDDIDAIKYLLARGMQFSIISVSIYFNYDYYKTKFLDHIVYLVIFIVVIGMVLDPYILSGRYSGIIWNPNMLSSFVVLAFSVLFLKSQNYSFVDIFLLGVLLFVALSTGSRGSIIGIVLVFIIKYGLSVRNILYGVLAISLFWIVSNIQLETSINRIADQSMFNDRILQYKYAWLSIKERIFFGYGLDKYAYIDKSLVPNYIKGIISSHNGYLAIITQYGIIFGGIILFITIKKSKQLLSYFRNNNESERIYFFIVIYTLIASIFETLMTGINEFHTILFWFSLAILSFSKFQKEYES